MKLMSLEGPAEKEISLVSDGASTQSVYNHTNWDTAILKFRVSATTQAV
jgi:hypothetical protein